MKNIILILLLINPALCLSESLILDISKNHFQIDKTNSLIISHIDNIESYSNLSSYSEIILSFDQNHCIFNSKPISLSYTDSYSVNYLSNQYTLYFTELPIISINTQNTILDDPKVYANFVYSDGEQIVISDIGIEIRGGTSQASPKKTYDLEFWKDASGKETIDVQFGNMRLDDDWILDALYNEPLRLRSYISNKLWLKMHTPHYLDLEPAAKAGADVKYVEMFLNGVYNGIYNISEQVDKKQLKLKSFNGKIRGELYKGITWGASTFQYIESYSNDSRLWSGYEMRYPDDDEITDWEYLYQYTDFVLNSSDQYFIDNVWRNFDYSNFMDYFIFLNLLRATDNTGKNIYLAKYTANEAYFYVPWDLDGCFGTIWDGTNSNITNDILRNGFYDRVIALNPNNYKKSISNRWFDYRNNILGKDNLINTIRDIYQNFANNKIYERESLVYPNYSFSTQDFDYLLNWLENRIKFLDAYFNAFLSADNNNTAKNELLIYPNPASDKIYFSNANLLTDNNYKIYNILGELIDLGTINNNCISIKNLRTGQYIVNIDNQSYMFIVI